MRLATQSPRETGTQKRGIPEPAGTVRSVRSGDGWRWGCVETRCPNDAFSHPPSRVAPHGPGSRSPDAIGAICRMANRGSKVPVFPVRVEEGKRGAGGQRE